MANELKMCVICGEDCAGQPRTKDNQGRYYHKHCYEQALQKKKARQAAAAAPPPVREEEPMSMLDELVDAPAEEVENPCPSCGASLASDAAICMNCGFNVTGGKKATTKVRKQKKERASRGGGSSVDWASYLRNPLYVSGAYLALNVVVLLLAKSAPENPMIALMVLAWIGFFVLMWFGVGIMILVNAFKEGIGTGLLTLCLPFYVLYFVYFSSPSQWAQLLFTVNLLTLGLLWLLFGGPP